MIEVSDHKGNKVSFHKEDVKEYREYSDSRYPTINSIITFYDGGVIEATNSYNYIKKELNE